jgi:ubiquitin-conjugating enzyme E2 J2
MFQPRKKIGVHVFIFRSHHTVDYSYQPLQPAMAPEMATKRLRKELLKLQKEPLPGIIAEPDESNILKWHYAVRGPSGTGFEGGVYVGKLVFPTEYPMKAPSIYMMTPSGRFVINTKLCMSMSNFHPESWNPLWSVSSIIQGVQSFMATDELTTGGLKSPASEHKKLAAISMAYNTKMFPKLFCGDIEAAFVVAERARIEAEKTAAASTADADTSRRSRARSSKSSSTKQKEAEVDNEKEEEPKELTTAEMEKRKKQNAKKRAKQKAKKAAQQQPTNEAAGSDETTGMTERKNDSLNEAD